MYKDNIPWNIITSAKIVRFFKNKLTSESLFPVWRHRAHPFLHGWFAALCNTYVWLGAQGNECGDQEFVCLIAHWENGKSDGPSLLYHSIRHLHRLGEASQSTYAYLCQTIPNMCGCKVSNKHWEILAEMRSPFQKFVWMTKAVIFNQDRGTYIWRRNFKTNISSRILLCPFIRHLIHPHPRYNQESQLQLEMMMCLRWEGTWKKIEEYRSEYLKRFLPVETSLEN